MSRKELILGAGSSKLKKRIWSPMFMNYEDPVRLDYNEDHNPDVVWDLTSVEPLPFDDNTFDEIHAYEVLEHIGQQGDYVTLFRQFSDYWRILKPGGMFYATVPWYESQWALGEPSHTRVITPGTLVFLNQPEYKEQVGKTAMSDFRSVYKADFNIAYVSKQEHVITARLSDGAEIALDESTFRFGLEAVKPSRWEDPNERRQ